MRRPPIRLTTVLWLFGAAAMVYEVRRAWRRHAGVEGFPPGEPVRKSWPPATVADSLTAVVSTHPPEAPPSPPHGSSQKRAPIQFTTLLLLLGVLLLLVVAGDMVVRGFWREIDPPVWVTSQAATHPGREAIVRYGCGGCHVIPGIRHATGRVGPQLTGFREQMYIAGVLPNVPANLVAWIENPQRFNPGTAMPNLNVSPEEAQAIAIYLYAQP